MPKVISSSLRKDVYGVARGLNAVLRESFDIQQKGVAQVIDVTGVADVSKWIKNVVVAGVTEFDVALSAKYAFGRIALLQKQTSIISRELSAHQSHRYKLLPTTTQGDASFVMEHEQQLESSPGYELTTSMPATNVQTTELEVSESISTEVHCSQALVKPLTIESSKPKSTDFDMSLTNRGLTNSRQRRVPSSQLGRIAGFGNLFFSLGLGAASEWAKRTVGYSGSSADETRKDLSVITSLSSNPFMTQANIERIVDTLCRMRGAALKLGQMLSIQDSTLVHPQVQKLFQRVRQSADFMPTHQMYSVINEELGPDWKSHLSDFEETPFAAASIGQVHRATLVDGRQVAVKIQYPGVAKSIDSDIGSLMVLLKRFNILPPGMFAESAVKVAKRELRLECDYIREAAFATKFRELLADDSVFIVPKVIPELSSRQVYTTEFFEGLVLDDCTIFDQDIRDWLGREILRLCLQELFVFKVMQTDPNWSNFLYNPNLGKIVLLDFGASMKYPSPFIDGYLKLIQAAAEGDRQKIMDYSKDLGFLTGYESKVFLDAHADAVQILGEAFASVEPFDFGRQSTTKKINNIIPVMLQHRLCPPPTETYSLHRKMSGCFLLCGKLSSTVNCGPLFNKISSAYKFGEIDPPTESDELVGTALHNPT